MTHAQWDMLNKTELTIEPIILEKANLNEIAAVIANVLNMERSDVFVTDLRKNTLTIDILKNSVNAFNLIGKKDELLKRLAELPGVITDKDTSIHSSGILGWIAMDDEEMQQSLKATEKIALAIYEKISKRVIVFSTGIEVKNGQIEDTNKPLIAKKLGNEGYKVTMGPTLPDNDLSIAAHLWDAVFNYGYGLVIITGGVGAEDKDHTVEAILRIDPEAATPYICKFEKGKGRHHKEGVRIAVGKINDSIIIAFPGPNDEVRCGLDVLVRSLSMEFNKSVLAEKIAECLRNRLREKMERHQL
jgi:molybdenum cofactor synthesis domain-containing protein